jgi:hypothetical protein
MSRFSRKIFSIELTSHSTIWTFQTLFCAIVIIPKRLEESMKAGTCCIVFVVLAFALCEPVIAEHGTGGIIGELLFAEAGAIVGGALGFGLGGCNDFLRIGEPTPDQRKHPCAFIWSSGRALGAGAMVYAVTNPKDIKEAITIFLLPGLWALLVSFEGGSRLMSVPFIPAILAVVGAHIDLVDLILSLFRPL